MPALSVSAIALMLLASGSVAANPSDTQLIAQNTDGAADDLSRDIEDLQRQIDSATEADRAKRASRGTVSELLKQADAKVQAGDLAGAESLLRQAAETVQPDDAVTRNRVTLAQATLKIRLGDLTGATALLDAIARQSTLSDTERRRLETLKGRIAAATTDARRRAAIAEIVTLADQAAIRRARDEVTRDPGNLGARLILGDLLRQAGQFDEAERTGEALVAETQGPSEAGTRQRALVLLARIATDRGDFSAARKRLDELRASPETPDKATRVADLEARIARQEGRAASNATEAARRAAVRDISGLAGEEAIARAREEIARDPQNADAQLLLGDLLRRSGQSEEAAQIAEDLAKGPATADDPGTRQRALVLLGRIAADQGDFAAARAALERLRATAETPQKATRIADLDTRIATQQKRAEQDAAFAEIAGLAPAEAISRAREEVARNPQSADAQLLLGDLLRRAGQSEEATGIAEGLAAGTATADDPGTRQRALVLLGRIATDQGDFAAARAALERLRATAETPQKAARMADLDQRIVQQEDRAAQQATRAARRATLDEIAKLPPRQAIEQARAEVAKDPQDFDSRLLLGDLLRRAGQFDEAAELADAVAVAADSPQDAGVQQRAIVLTGRIEIDRGDFAAAHKALERLAATAETPQKAQRVADLDERITREQARAAERAATEARKARERAEKERIAAENARIDAALAEINALPPAEALERSRAFYAANPDNPRVANAHARLLTRAWEWQEAEDVYMRMLGPKDGLDDAALVENNGAVLGLVDLYSRTNRLALANEWLARLEAAYSGDTVPPRVGTLRDRIDDDLRPDQFSGSLTLSVGYNDNVSAPVDDFFDDNQTEDLLPNEGSSFVSADLRMRYDRIVSPNGDRLRLQARIEGRPYLELAGVDRASYDINGGYIYNVPGTRAEVQALIGFKSRYIDYESYRRTLYGLLNYNTDINPLTSTSATLRIEANDDDEPDLDGWAVEGDGRITYDLTPQTTVGLRGNARYEDAQTDADSRGIIGATFSIRHEFDVGSLTGFYALASYNPYFTRYGGPITSGVDTGVVRQDFTQKVAVAVGRNLSPLWRMELGANYSIRSSNVEGKDDNGTEIKFSVTRLFSGGSAPASDDDTLQPRVNQPGAWSWR